MSTIREDLKSIKDLHDSINEQLQKEEKPQLADGILDHLAPLAERGLESEINEVLDHLEESGNTT
jgi:hypothetical protein